MRVQPFKQAHKLHDMAEAAHVALEDSDEIAVPAYINKLIGDAEKAMRAIMDACADEPDDERAREAMGLPPLSRDDSPSLPGLPAK